MFNFIRKFLWFKNWLDNLQKFKKKKNTFAQSFQFWSSMQLLKKIGIICDWCIYFWNLTNSDWLTGGRNGVVSMVTCILHGSDKSDWELKMFSGLSLSWTSQTYMERNVCAICRFFLSLKRELNIVMP